MRFGEVDMVEKLTFMLIKLGLLDGEILMTSNGNIIVNYNTMMFKENLRGILNVA